MSPVEILQWLADNSQVVRDLKANYKITSMEVTQKHLNPVGFVAGCLHVSILQFQYNISFLES
jgi:hypothetical protein